MDSALLLGSSAFTKVVMMLYSCRRLVLVLKHELVVFLLEKAAHFNLIII